MALKGKNRPEFVKTLRRNIARGLWGLSPTVDSRDGRLFVAVEGAPEEAEARLARVFGVAWFSRIEEVAKDLPGIFQSAVAEAQASTEQTFRVEARRNDKSFPKTSSEVAGEAGAAIVERTGKKVDLSHPGVTVHIDILSKSALVYSRKTKGPGGLPLGTAGKTMHLFSGGIDSPVAAWLLMKRGVRPVYVHFYLAPTPAYALESKVVKQLKILSLYGGKSTMVLVPFADYQLATLGRAGELEPSLFRRFMRVTAELLAPRFAASAVSTGDSLSQAASQTLWNLSGFDSGASLPILRPLLTYDKEEIITMARTIGTYEASLEEYKDCCAIVTRHPRTRVPSDLVSSTAESLRFQDLAQASLRSATLVSYAPSTGVLKSGALAEAMEADDQDEKVPEPLMS